MNLYAIIGGSIWGNRGAEAMVVTTIGRVRERDPNASFVIMTYFPRKDRELVQDEEVGIVGARPTDTIVQVAFGLLCRFASLLGIRLPDAMLPSSVRVLRQCRALFDVSGVSFHDGRLAVVVYNLFCLWPAFLLGVPVVRLSQAMGPFENLLNRIAARWAFRRSMHSFARGRHTAGYIESLGVTTGSWSLASDVAFSYTPSDSLTDENPHRVAELASRLGAIRSDGIEIVAVVPSSLVYQKTLEDGGDYVAILCGLIRELQSRGLHVLILPNATREGHAVARNNDIVVIEEIWRIIAVSPHDIDVDFVTYVDFDLNTKSIRQLAGHCSLIITSRFHAMVAGLALGVPTLVMGWSHKYDEVLEMFGCADNAIDFSEAEGRLAPMAVELLANAESVRKRILEALPEVVASSRSQFEVVDRLSAVGRR